jgi:sugar phosphate isomerase/epimerase
MPRIDEALRGMGRRGFLNRLAGAAAAGMAFPITSMLEPLTTLARGAVPMPVRQLGRIGIQVYTVRSLMPRDPDGTLAALASIGYTEVELAGFYGNSPEAMRRMLDRHGLTAVSGHVSLPDMRRDWSRALDDAATLGQRYIVCSSFAESDRSINAFHRNAHEMNELAATARQHGLQFGYHNHMYEFAPVDGVVPYDILLTECDPHLVQMEVDLMWMTKGGGDPIAYFHRYPGRFPMVHVKDMTKDGTMVDVGQGSIDFARIFAQSDLAGIKHYFVEHDDPPNPIVDARTCYEYLRQLKF